MKWTRIVRSRLRIDKAMARSGELATHNEHLEFNCDGPCVVAERRCLPPMSLVQLHMGRSDPEI